MNTQSRRRTRRTTLLEKTDGICGICGEPIHEWEPVQADHIVPKSWGGSNNPENLQPSHAWCNQKKRNLGAPNRDRIGAAGQEYRDASYYFTNGWKDDDGRKIPLATQSLIIKASERRVRPCNPS